MEIVKELLNRGAEVNKGGFCSTRTALKIAVERENIDVIRMLLMAKADPDHGKDEPYSALTAREVAQKSSSKEIREMFKEKPSLLQKLRKAAQRRFSA